MKEEEVISSSQSPKDYKLVRYMRLRHADAPCTRVPFCPLCAITGMHTVVETG